MAPPNVDFGSPAIFFDSDPSAADSYLYSYWSWLKGTLHIAWTGVVPKPLQVGTLRLIFHTDNDTQGMKDFELHEYALVREAYDEALRQPDVVRALVMGYSGQNPYIMYGGKNPWVERFERERRGKERQEREEKQRKMDNGKEEREGKLIDMQEVIEQTNEMEEERQAKFEREKPKMDV